MLHTTDEKQYKLLDTWLAEEIISLALGTGHKKGNFRKVPFNKLRKMGLLSLVHRRRLLQHGHIKDGFEQVRDKYLSDKSAKLRTFSQMR